MSDILTRAGGITLVHPLDASRGAGRWVGEEVQRTANSGWQRLARLAHAMRPEGPLMGIRHAAALLTFLAAGMVLVAPGRARAGPPRPETLEAWDEYVTREEQRIDTELAGGGDEFLVFDRVGASVASGAQQRLRRGEVVIIPRGQTRGHGSGATVPSGLIHHWLGAVLIPGATVEEVLAFVQDYDNHAPYFTEVLASRLLERSGDRFTIYLKLERKKVITVRYGSEHVVDYRRLGARAASASRSTKIAELADVGTPREREKPPEDDRGFLWRLNSYWRFDPRPEGLVLECESISLSRDVPTGLGWLVNGFVKGISRESLERTLASIRDGVLSRRRQNAVPAIGRSRLGAGTRGWGFPARSRAFGAVTA